MSAGAADLFLRLRIGAAMVPHGMAKLCRLALRRPAG